MFATQTLTQRTSETLVFPTHLFILPFKRLTRLGEKFETFFGLFETMYGTVFSWAFIARYKRFDGNIFRCQVSTRVFLLPFLKVCKFTIDHIDTLRFPFSCQQEKHTILSFTHLEQILPGYFLEKFNAPRVLLISHYN